MLKALFYPVGTTENPISFESLYIPWIFKEIYFEKVYRSLIGNKDLTIIDFGGNIGLVTMYMRQFAKIVYTMEPSSEHYEALEMNKKANGWDNVELFKMALSDKNGKTKLGKQPENLTMNSITSGYSEGEMVKTVTIDKFFKDNKIKHVDFIKLDIEGAEEQVLMGKGFKKVSPMIDAIEVEFHTPNWTNITGYMVNVLGYNASKFNTDATILLFSR